MKKSNNFLRSVSIVNDHCHECQSASVSFNDDPFTGCLNDLVVTHNNLKAENKFDAKSVTVTYSSDLLAAVMSKNLFEVISSAADLDNDYEFVYVANDVYKYVDDNSNYTYFITIYPDSYRITKDKNLETNEKIADDIECSKPEKPLNDCSNSVEPDGMMSLKNIVERDITNYNTTITEEFDITPCIDYISQGVIYGNYNFVVHDVTDETISFIDPTEDRETNANIIGVVITTDDETFIDHKDEIVKHLCSNELFDFSAADIVRDGNDDKILIFLYV